VRDEAERTSSPSRNGIASSLRTPWPTVLFPEPAGPVTTQICWRVLGSVGSVDNADDPVLGSISGMACGSFEEATAGVTGG